MWAVLPPLPAQIGGSPELALQNFSANPSFCPSYFRPQWIYISQSLSTLSHALDGYLIALSHALGTAAPAQAKRWLVRACAQHRTAAT